MRATPPRSGERRSTSDGDLAANGEQRLCRWLRGHRAVRRRARRRHLGADDRRDRKPHERAVGHELRLERRDLHDPAARVRADADRCDARADQRAAINGLPINGLPINGLPINGLPINGLPINGLPINGLPINGLPINGLPINGLPINGLPINGLPINGLQIPGGWTAVLAGTPLAGKPLQTITLQQVLALNPQPAAVHNLTLGNLVVADSALGQVTIGALALGSTRRSTGSGPGGPSIERSSRPGARRLPGSRSELLDHSDRQREPLRTQPCRRADQRTRRSTGSR